MKSPLLSVKEFDDARGTPTPEDDLMHVQWLLEVAEERLLERVPSIPRRLDSGELSLVLVQGALVDIVTRALPDGKTEAPTDPFLMQQSFGAGPYTMQQSWRERVFIMNNDIKPLLPKRRGARSIMTKTPRWRIP